MHAGFIRQFEEHQIDFLQDSMSWLSVKKYGMWIQLEDVCLQYILDQLYFNVPRVVKEDFLDQEQQFHGDQSFDYLQI